MVSRDGMEVSGDSIMGLMMLAAGCGTSIDVVVEGADAEALAAALRTLVAAASARRTEPGTAGVVNAAAGFYLKELVLSRGAPPMIKILSWAALILAALAGPAAADTIRVGMSGGYFPFTFVQQDKLQGFEVDFMNAIAAKTGDTVEFSTMSFSGLIGALQAGRIDTVANQITITPEREAQFVFSQPYVYDGAQIVVQARATRPDHGRRRS